VYQWDQDSQPHATPFKRVTSTGFVSWNDEFEVKAPKERAYWRGRLMGEADEGMDQGAQLGAAKGTTRGTLQIKFFEKGR
jgi:hypothetical protein